MAKKSPKKVKLKDKDLPKKKAKEVKGGLLLPAVQAAREAAGRRST